MTSITSKVCVVGDFAVGKTSAVERFVNNHFSDKYLTTVGVKIDTKEILLPEQNVSIKLIIWDVAGAEEFGDKEFAYLRGASGFVYVSDGTRLRTLDSAYKIREQIELRYNAQPNVLLLNKSDLAGTWQAKDDHVSSASEKFGAVYKTSAKDGDEVDTALTRLAELIVAKDLQPVQ